MEKATINKLLEKYWRAETSVEEERVLAAYFKGPAVDSDLLPYAGLFAYFDEESQVSPGPDFDARILRAVESAGLAGAEPLMPARERSSWLGSFNGGMMAAAAAVLVVVSGLFLFTPQTPTIQPTIAAGTTAGTNAGTTAGQIPDTYDDPGQALAAVRHALLIASAHLNEGRKQITNR